MSRDARRYDRRIPERHPGGRSCKTTLATFGVVVATMVMALSGCGPIDVNNAPLTPVHGAGLGQGGGQ